MRKNAMYFDTHRAKINRNIYRPSSNLFRFIKTVCSVLISGQSPIGTDFSKRKFH